MHINNIGYNHCHDADFCIQRPDGSGDYLLLLIKTPAVFTLSETDTFTEANSFILYKEGTPQFYRAYGTQFSNGSTLSFPAATLTFLTLLISLLTRSSSLTISTDFHL